MTWLLIGGEMAEPGRAADCLGPCSSFPNCSKACIIEGYVDGGVCMGTSPQTLSCCCKNSWLFLYAMKLYALDSIIFKSTHCHLLYAMIKALCVNEVQYETYYAIIISRTFLYIAFVLLIALLCFENDIMNTIL